MAAGAYHFHEPITQPEIQTLRNLGNRFSLSRFWIRMFDIFFDLLSSIIHKIYWHQFEPNQSFSWQEIMIFLSVNTNSFNPEYHFCVKYGTNISKHSMEASTKLQKISKTISKRLRNNLLVKWGASGRSTLSAAYAYNVSWTWLEIRQGNSLRVYIDR